MVLMLILMVFSAQKYEFGTEINRIVFGLRLTRKTTMGIAAFRQFKVFSFFFHYYATKIINLIWGFLTSFGMTCQCFIEEGERGAGGEAARPSLPKIPLPPGHSDGVPKACLPPGRRSVSGRLRNLLLPGFQLFAKMCH